MHSSLSPSSTPDFVESAAVEVWHLKERSIFTNILFLNMRVRLGQDRIPQITFTRPVQPMCSTIYWNDHNAFRHADACVLPSDSFWRVTVTVHELESNKVCASWWVNFIPKISWPKWPHYSFAIQILPCKTLSQNRNPSLISLLLQIWTVELEYRMENSMWKS